VISESLTRLVMHELENEKS